MIQALIGPGECRRGRRGSRPKAPSALPATSRHWRICRCPCSEKCKARVRAANGRPTEALRQRWAGADYPGGERGAGASNPLQASTAFALRGLFRSRRICSLSAVVSRGVNYQAALGSRRPFDARIHEVRGQRGQIDAAALYRHLLTDDSAISQSHHSCSKVQGPCTPCAASRAGDGRLPDADPPGGWRCCWLKPTRSPITPLVFCPENDVISGGNFHAGTGGDGRGIISRWRSAEIGSLPETPHQR